MMIAITNIITAECAIALEDTIDMVAAGAAGTTTIFR